MTGSFDPYDKNSWYFGNVTRSEAANHLMRDKTIGAFLIRNSTSVPGDLVLSVREEHKVNHYIINRVVQEEQLRFRIGDQMFSNIPSLLNFYKLHFLDTTPLIRPAVREIEKVQALFDFDGTGDPDDLPFKKGEVLVVLSKDEDQWWTAQNDQNQTGSIPVPYITPVKEEEEGKTL